MPLHLTSPACAPSPWWGFTVYNLLGLTDHRLPCAALVYFSSFISYPLFAVSSSLLLIDTKTQGYFPTPNTPNMPSCSIAPRYSL